MTYDEALSEIKTIQCLTPRKLSEHSPQSFCIRGTRVYFRIYHHSLDLEKQYSIEWSYKAKPSKYKYSDQRKKAKKKYVDVSFEEVLGLDFIGTQAKQELLFHLDLFR